MWSNIGENIKKRIGRYLLQRYLGQYLQEKLTLDQLHVDIYKGTGTVRDVTLDCQALNSAAEQQNIPIEFKDGHLGRISVLLPWYTLMSDSCEIEISGMQVTIQSKKRSDNGSSMLESMWTSMASSMQLAEDCLKTSDSDDERELSFDADSQMSGVEKCAQAIEEVLSRVKMCFRDSIVRIEQAESDSRAGVAAEFHIKLWKYSDEACIDDREDQKKFGTPFTEKRIVLEGIECFSDIFKSKPKEHYSSSNDNASGSASDSNGNLIRIAKFNGSHTIKLRIKKDESIGGPQISTDCKFGSFVAFLSPIQAHIFLKLLNELLNPESRLDDASRKQKEKPMDTFDFRRVEEELQEQLKPGGIGIPGIQQQGWSNLSPDESDEEFLPMQRTKSGNFSSVHSTLMNHSTFSGTSSMQQSMTESLASTAAPQTFYCSSNSPKKIKESPLQTQEEKTQFSVSFASTIIILLHEDILVLNTSSVESSSVSKMRTCSQTFFESLGFGATVSGKKDLEQLRDKLSSACSLSHMRLIGAPFKLEGIMCVADGTPLTVGHASLGYCDLAEFLHDSLDGAKPLKTYIDVLSFSEDFVQSTSEAIRIDFKHRNYRSRTPTTKTTLRITLQTCTSELDISIISRINSVLNTQLYFYTTTKIDGYDSDQHPTSGAQNTLLMKLICPFVAVNFRFPIPDCRAETDIGRIPSWIRNIRDDSVVIQAKDFIFSTALNSSLDTTDLDFKCEELELLYKENDRENPILFAEARSYDSEVEGASIQTRGFDWPRVVVSISREKHQQPKSEKDNPEELDSLDLIAENNSHGPSVFTARRIIHESLGSENEENSNNHESVIPGDRVEMAEFADAASRDTLYKIEMNLRSLSVCLPSKHFFQELYNRFSNDLLLWEVGKCPQFRKVAPSTPFRSFGPASFGSKTTDSESDDEEELSAFYVPNPAESVPSNRNKRNLQKGQSDVTVNLVVNKGTCSFFTPFTNLDGSVVPEQRGQITLDVQQLTLFVVSGFKGNKNLGYVCLHTNKAELHHSDLLSPDIEVPKFGKHLRRTLYRSEVEVPSKSSSESINCDSSDMLAVAIKIDREPEKNVKTFKVAVSIREATLDHRMKLPYRSWFNQLVDFFDVTDTLISGYTPAPVLTELHLHLWNCSIDCSPINLPLRCVLCVDAFSISSNIAASTNTKVIRFVSEDASLYVSPKVTSNDLRKDYVCVMEMDFFELSFRRSQSRNNEIPRMELKASNNILHIRTCSDSCKALFNLIVYYANDGDLNEVPILSDEKNLSYSPVRESISEPALIGTDEFCDKERRMSQSQTEHVNDLVAEAMLDSNAQNEQHDYKHTKSKFTVEANDFYGPRSNSASRHYYEPILQSADGLPVEINVSDEDEEEFCLLENDPGVGILSKSGEPEARVLTSEPVRLIENHFAVPLGRTDILKAPKHYPMAINRYTMQDVSIIWHLYGGEDFGPSWSSRQGSNKLAPKCPSESDTNLDGRDGSNVNLNMFDQTDPEVDLGIDALSPGAVFSKTKAFESPWDAYESPKSQRRQNLENANTGGGKGRRNDVCVELHLNKIKFQHEVYPDHTEQASRQVLVINNVEIRDRLKSSQFNKMLYLYTSATKPKQSHAHMVIIKAAHIRPDPQLGIEECCLKISLLPVRLNIDQDALLFLYQFYQNMSPKNEAEDEDGILKPPSHTPSVESLPVMTVNMTECDEQNQSNEGDASNLLLFEDPSIAEDNASICSKDPSIDSNKPPGPIFFRQIIFSPEVPVRLDYRGKRMDMTHGPLAGILMGLAQLNCLEVQLKRINHRNGILGIERLWAFLLVELTNDIKKNQLPNLLGGVGPMYSFVQLFQGVRDLFWLPYEQYQKDGRLAKGLQRGANAFSTSAAMAALELTNRLVQTIQGAAEFTYDMVSPGPSVQQQRRQSSYKKKRHGQPGDIREGVANAYHVVKEGLGDTAKTIVRVASKEHEQKGVSGAVGGVLRQIPPTVVRPIILVAEATSSVIGGFRSQLEPEFKKEAEEKWKDS